MRAKWVEPAYEGIQAVLASNHGKERVVAPLLAAEIGLQVELANGVDTDRFGTFSHEIEQVGGPLQAARSKIAACFSASPWAQVGLASEGSFAPHPAIPFLAVGRELVLMIDRRTGREPAGTDVTLETNFQQAVANDIEGALAFARKIGWPQHGLVVLGCHQGRPAPKLLVDKAVTEVSLLELAVAKAIDLLAKSFSKLICVPAGTPPAWLRSSRRRAILFAGSVNLVRSAAILDLTSLINGSTCHVHSAA
jgi:hypothetical protein